jgi:hypothetical protein
MFVVSDRDEGRRCSRVDDGYGEEVGSDVVPNERAEEMGSCTERGATNRRRERTVSVASSCAGGDS